MVFDATIMFLESSFKLESIIWLSNKYICCNEGICFSLNENVLVFTEAQRKPIRSVDSSFGGQSFSTGSSPSLSHDLHANDDYEQEEDFHAEVARENSFEDLEQFLTQLDWAPPQGNAETTGSEAELFCEQEQDEQNLQELEMTALKEHLKAIVKDIHIAIGEHGGAGLRLFYISLVKTIRVFEPLQLH